MEGMTTSETLLFTSGKKLFVEFSVIRRTYLNFDELCYGVQDDLIRGNWDCNVAFEDWSEFYIDEYKKRLDSLGFCDPKVYFSGFGSQGDGACFESTNLDIPKLVRSCGLYNDLRFLYCRVTQFGDDAHGSVTHRGSRYYHSQSIRCDLDGDLFSTDDPDLGDKFADQIKKLEGAVLELAREESDDIYRDLTNVFNHLTSDEAVSDYLRGLTFDAEGNILY